MKAGQPLLLSLYVFCPSFHLSRPLCEPCADAKLCVDEWRSAFRCHVALFARSFSRLPQLFWQRIPLALGSHRAHKLISHLLESSADSEAGRVTANILLGMTVPKSFSKAEALSEGRSWVKCCHCCIVVYFREWWRARVFPDRLLTIYSENMWPLLAPFHQEADRGYVLPLLSPGLKLLF